MPQWTQQQEAFYSAVTETTSSIALIAKAGAGKTSSLEEAIKRVLAKDPTTSILCLAFNAKIKKELESRLPKNVSCKTLNGAGHSALMRFLGNRGIAVEQNKIGTIVAKLLSDDEEMREHWSAIVQLVGKAKTHGLVPAASDIPGTPRGVIPDTYEEWQQLASFYDLDFNRAIYDIAREALIQSIKQTFEGLIDFDDQIYIPVVYRLAFPQFDLIFVDESQDLNDLQHIVVQKSKRSPRGRIVAVGDPNQAIYGFRGARHDSMDKLIADHSMQVLPLSVSFRCAQAVIREARKDVPDIEAAPWAERGSVIKLGEWDHTTFLHGDAIACRNMAPLMAVAYRLIGKGIGVHVLGRDVGAGLKALIKKLAGKPARCDMQTLEHRITEWAAREASEFRSKGQLHKIDQVYDKAESLLAVIDFAGCDKPDELEPAIDSLFGRNTGKVTLMTGHGSKGLEFDRFFILDPWRLPSKYAAALGEDSWQYQQEINLRYVLRTRAKKFLCYINSDGWPSERGENEARVLQTDSMELAIRPVTAGDLDLDADFLNKEF